MRFDMIAPVFLVLAIAFSWPRTVAVFRSKTSPLLAASPLTMIASAISISSFGLAFSANDPWLGSLIATTGVLLGTVARGPAPTIAAMSSVLCISAYLQLH